MDARKTVLHETAVIAVGQALCLAFMFGLYALLGKFSLAVALGGVAGALIAVGNFFFMALVASLAADKAQNQDVDGGKKLLSLSYPLRLLAIGAVLGVLALSGYFDPLALVLPLAFVRPILLVNEFFRKKED